MESLVKLFYECEIQVLVLLSFTLQIFLFFTGGLRRHSTNMFFRLSIWIAYLGADLVAVYGLGYLSRQVDITQPLTFFWAPFLLIHLGGQDTITAFSMEDNNLWMRHFLNLVVQAALALYVFWKWIGRHSVDLIVSGIFVFISGIIKYGERTWSLKCGNFKSLESSTGHHYKQRLPEVTDEDVGYSNIVCTSLYSMLNVLNVFAARTLFATGSMRQDAAQDPNKMLKVVELELGMMYDDLYTKALVVKTRSGIILRCISQISAVVAFALFLASNKGRYSRADIAITYSLFAGGFFLEVCAMFIVMMSPWTWAWLKVRKYNGLARLSWFLFSSDIGWPEKRPLWSNSMGQYNLVNWLAGSDQPRSWNQQVMTMVRKLMNLVGADKEKMFWMSKLLETEYVKVDKEMEYVAKGISRLISDDFSEGPRGWPNIRPLLKEAQGPFIADFGFAIVYMHMFTEVHLSKYHPPPSDEEANAAEDTKVMVEACRKLSNYMMYLLVTQPSMLPLNASAVATLKEWQARFMEVSGNGGRDFILRRFNEMVQKVLSNYDPPPSKDMLEEMVDMWTRFLIYAAGKSRPEAHAAQLSRGGELLTFTWLLMAHNRLGDSEYNRIRITDASAGAGRLREVYAFNFRLED